MQMIAQNDVSEFALSALPCMEIIKQIHALESAQILHTVIMIPVSAYRLASLMCLLTVLLNTLMLKTPLLFVFISVLLIAGLIISHTLVLVTAAWATTLIHQLGNVF